MPVTVVVGGQFGSEGKGKVAHYLAREMGATIAIRVGGPNSGHTVFTEGGLRLIFRQLPTAAILPDVRCILPAGSYIYPPLLIKEMQTAGLPPERLLIDPNAVVISQENIEEENTSGLRHAIGSTLTGTGAAVVSRINRLGKVRLAREEEILKPFVRATVPFVYEHLEKKARVIVEGTQGFGLSVLHSPYYPYCTSRDTTAAGFISEAGVSPLDVDDVVMVIRAFPIRVSGSSGPLPNEVSWEELTKDSRSKNSLIEYTSVSGNVRCVARFDSEIVRQAILYNRPTRIALNHLDYIDTMSGGNFAHTSKTISFVHNIEMKIESSISYIGFGSDHLAKNDD
jgi:adenylosuccinate synthase